MGIKSTDFQSHHANSTMKSEYCFEESKSIEGMHLCTSTVFQLQTISMVNFVKLYKQSALSIMEEAKEEKGNNSESVLLHVRCM